MQTASKKVVNGWAMYDWANSVYNLVITTTFFPIYFLAVTGGSDEGHLVHFLGRDFVNSSLYDYTLAVAYLIIAILYPILTSIADTRGNKKNFMRFFCYMGAIGCSILFFFKSDTLGLGIFAFMLAAMGFVGSLVFYNAYLPEIAAPEDRDRISARGFSFGYIGSVLMQIVGFLLVTFMTDKALATRITFLLVGVWWIGFAQIAFARLPKAIIKPSEKRNVFKDGFVEIKKVYRQVAGMPVLKRFLRGFFFYSMAVQTVMLAATLFGSKVLKLPDAKLIITVVIIQLVAIIGAWSMSRLSMKYGNLKVLMAVILIWILICLAAYYTASLADQGINAEYYFYGLAVGVGLVMGGIQSLSRSTYSKLMPETKDTSSFFSYYDTTEKVAIVIGILSFGLIEELTGSMKNSLLSLIVFFIIGFLWLYAALRKRSKLLRSMKLYTINAGYFKLDGGAMFGVVPKSIWNKLNPSDENNLCSWALRCLLIEEGNKLILVDNGIGNKQDAKFFSHYYLHGDDTLDKSLAKHGFQRDDITDVILTHLHFDHCGGSIIRDGEKLIPAFKNATYWSNKQHWEWAVNPNEREKASFLKENILPIKESGQLKMVNSEWSIVNSEKSSIIKSGILDSVSLRVVSGHTESMMLPQINYKGKTIVFMADLLPSQAHIPLPYVMAYDMFPMMTLNEKKLFLKEAADNDYILFFEHDPKYECCNLQYTERGIRAKDFFKLEEV